LLNNWTSFPLNPKHQSYRIARSDATMYTTILCTWIKCTTDGCIFCSLALVCNFTYHFWEKSIMQTSSFECVEILVQQVMYRTPHNATMAHPLCCMTCLMPTTTTPYHLTCTTNQPNSNNSQMTTANAISHFNTKHRIAITHSMHHNQC